MGRVILSGEINFDLSCLNCADSWAGRELTEEARNAWRESDRWREAGLTAGTTYPQGVSLTGVWDGAGNVWEWTQEISEDGWVPIRGGSWYQFEKYARVSARNSTQPGLFNYNYGFRLVVAPV